MLYEIKVENRRYCSFESMMLEHKNEFNHDEFQELVREANYSIQEFIEEHYDDMNEKMVDIAETWEEVSCLHAVADWLCEYKGFSRWYPKKKISVYLDG